MNLRHKSREAALQALYRMDIADGGPAEEFESSIEGLPPGTEAHRYAEFLVKGAAERLKELDALIEERSENWTVERMAVVDRNILRIAVFELYYCREVPYKVIIDEAVELAKRYGSEESGAFINGVLDRVHRDIMEKMHPAH